MGVVRMSLLLFQIPSRIGEMDGWCHVNVVVFFSEPERENSAECEPMFIVTWKQEYQFAIVRNSSQPFSSQVNIDLEMGQI